MLWCGQAVHTAGQEAALHSRVGLVPQPACKHTAAPLPVQTASTDRWTPPAPGTHCSHAAEEGDAVASTADGGLWFGKAATSTAEVACPQNGIGGEARLSRAQHPPSILPCACCSRDTEEKVSRKWFIV